MQGSIGPNVAKAAVALRRNHPGVSALEILDACMRERVGSVADFGAELTPDSPFGELVVEAVGHESQDWSEVLTLFAQRYGLSE